jgi:phosphatidylglycerol lysyltransferase
VEQLLLKYGYALLFGGVLVEGEAFLLGAALLARAGLLSLPLVIAVAVAANSLADLTFFVLARRRGRAWLTRRYGSQERFRRLLALVGRHGFPLLLVSRFAYGLRAAIPAACGVTDISAVAFVATDLLAGLLWAVPVALLGYRTGQAVGPLLVAAKRYELSVALALGAAAVLGFAIFLGLRHLRALARGGRLGAVDLHRLVPLFIGFTGLVNLATALWPAAGSLASFETWLPVEVVQRSRPLMLFSGLALLQVARNLSRGKALAWWVAVVALGVSLASHLGHGSGMHHALAAGLLVGWLWVYRRRYSARTDPQSVRRALLMAPVLAALVLAYGTAGLRRYEAQLDWRAGATPVLEAVRSGVLIGEPWVEPRTERAARFLGSLQIAGWIARLYLLVLLLRPVMARQRLEAPAEAVQAALRAWARRSLQCFAVEGDKHHLLVAEGRGLVAYAVRAGVALAAGDPLVADESLLETVRAYIAHCRSNGWTPCIYEASEEALPVYRTLGLKGFKMAEEAVIDLPGFSLAGGKRATLRAMVSKASRLGLVVEAYDRRGARNPGLDAQLEEVSREWLAGKRLGEMGFTVTRFSRDALDTVRVFFCRDGERVMAFCTFREYRGGRAVVLDLMRKRAAAVSGTMDLLLARALERLRDEGLEEASLANAPLANTRPPTGVLERGVAVLFERAGGPYGYRSLFQFKKKFAPRWESRYLIYPAPLDLPRVAYAMASVHGMGGLRELLLGR